MSQSYTGGDQSAITSNATVYVTHGGTDLGFLSPGVSIGFPQGVAPRRFAQSKSPYAFVNTQGDAFVEGVMHQLTQALLLKLMQNATSLDGGNAIGINGDFGVVLSEAEAWTYFLHNISGLPKRMKYPKAILHINGPIPAGADVEELAAPFRMVATKDNTASANEQLLRLYYNEDETEVTITPSPADAATGVSTSATITLTFSAAIGTDFQVIAADNSFIKLIRADTGVNALTSVSWNAAGTVATLAHATLQASTGYLIIVDGSLRAASGRKVAGDGSNSGTTMIANFTTA